MIKQHIPLMKLCQIPLANLIVLSPTPYHLKVPALVRIIEIRKRLEARRIDPHLRHQPQVRRAHQLLPQIVDAMANMQFDKRFRVDPHAEPVLAVVVVPDVRGLAQDVEAVQVVQGLDRDEVAAALGAEALDEAGAEVGFGGAVFVDY
jgi:hypothetical protein